MKSNNEKILGGRSFTFLQSNPYSREFKKTTKHQEESVQSNIQTKSIRDDISY